jgi:hypothetical protein
VVAVLGASEAAELSHLDVWKVRCEAQQGTSRNTPLACRAASSAMLLSPPVQVFWSVLCVTIHTIKSVLCFTVRTIKSSSHSSTLHARLCPRITPRFPPACAVCRC